VDIYILSLLDNRKLFYDFIQVRKLEEYRNIAETWKLNSKKTAL